MSLRRALLSLPLLFVGLFVLCPLAVTLAVSFWRRNGFRLEPAFSLQAYETFFGTVRLGVLERSLWVALLTTLLALLLAYPPAYLLALRTRPQVARIVLLLLTVPFLVNYVIRNLAWAYLLGRKGPVNDALTGLGLIDRPLDWLLYSDLSVFVGLLSSYMPVMVFPLWLSLSAIDRRLIEASKVLGAGPPATFLRVTLPLSLPGLFAAAVFCLVGVFGESAVPLILGGAGYELMGNTIASAMSVLDYPLAAAMSSVVAAVMALLLLGWYLGFDLRTFLGQLARRPS